MARINLLPWRQEERQRKNNDFNVLIAGTLLAAGLCAFLGYYILNSMLNNQLDANKRIEDANAQLEVALTSITELEAQRDQMLSQMKVIQDLQGRRSIPVRVWDDMAKAVPAAMYLVSIKRENDTITITGQADNANVVAALVRNLNSSVWLDGSAVVSIKSKVQAYQEPTTTLPETKNADGTTSTRPMYPEDNYVEFVVTTQVQHPQEQTDANATGEQAVGMPQATATEPTTIDPNLAQPLGVEPVPADASQPQVQPQPAPAATPAPAPATPAPEAQPPSEANVGKQR